MESKEQHKPGDHRISINEILTWAKKNTGKDVEKATEIYTSILKVEKAANQLYPDQFGRQTKDEFLKQQKGKTFQVQKGCELYDVINTAKKKNVTGSSDAFSQYQYLKYIEKKYHELIDQKVPGKAKKQTDKPTTLNDKVTDAKQKEIKQPSNSKNSQPATNSSGVTKSPSKGPAVSSPSGGNVNKNSKEQTARPSKSLTDKNAERAVTSGTASAQLFTNTVHVIPVSGDYQQNSRQREPSPSSTHRQMISIPKEQYDRLNNTIEIQQAKIDDLVSRLSSFASKQLTDGNPNIADLSDKNRPSKIGEKFAELYDNEWADAYEALRPAYKSDSEIVSLLSAIVKVVYSFCQEVAELQLRRINDYMEDVVTNLKICRNGQYLRVERPPEDPTHLAVTRKIAREYRKETAMASVPALCVLFCDVEFRDKFPSLSLPRLPDSFTSYIHKGVEFIWLMCLQNPPMVLEWQSSGTAVNTEVFKFYNNKGKNVNVTVWPALYLHEGGPLVNKGYVLPS